MSKPLRQIPLNTSHEQAIAIATALKHRWTMLGFSHLYRGAMIMAPAKLGAVGRIFIVGRNGQVGLYLTETLNYYR